MKKTKSQKIIKQYEIGHLTEMSATYDLFDNIEPEEVATLPQEWYDRMKPLVEREDWSRMIFVQSVCAIGDYVHPTQEEQRAKASARAKLLRPYFNMGKTH